MRILRYSHPRQRHHRHRLAIKLNKRARILTTVREYTLQCTLWSRSNFMHTNCNFTTLRFEPAYNQNVHAIRIISYIENKRKADYPFNLASKFDDTFTCLNSFNFWGAGVKIGGLHAWGLHILTSIMYGFTVNKAPCHIESLGIISVGILLL